MAADGTTILDSRRWEVIRDHFNLSSREAEVVKMMFRDATERDMATCLKVSVHTVHKYRARVFKKLHAHSPTGVIVRVLTTSTENTP